MKRPVIEFNLDQKHEIALTPSEWEERRVKTRKELSVVHNLIVEELRQLSDDLETMGLIYDRHGSLPSREWEYSTAVLMSGVKSGERILDCGGAATLLPLYLARKGCDVVTIDINVSRVEKADRISKALQLNTLNLPMDMAHLDGKRLGSFDRVFSISVLEHLTQDKQQEKSIRGMGKVLRPGGTLTLTFDMGALIEPPGKPYFSRTDVWRRIVRPSRLKVVQDLILPPKNLRQRTAKGYGLVVLGRPKKFSELDFQWKDILANHVAQVLPNRWWEKIFWTYHKKKKTLTYLLKTGEVKVNPYKTLKKDPQ